MLNFYYDFTDKNKKFTDFFISREYMRDFIEQSEVVGEMVAFLEIYINKKIFDEIFNMAINTFPMENFKFKMKYCPVNFRKNLERS